MAARVTTVRRNGQITIPIEIRRSLGLAEGDRLAVEQQGNVVLLRRTTSVAEYTAGILAAYRKDPPLSAEEERAAFPQAVADEVAGSGPEGSGCVPQPRHPREDRRGSPYTDGVAAVGWIVRPSTSA